jgi:DNA-3-methyladenine glycosylase II
MPRDKFAKAIGHLKAVDPVLAGVIDTVGKCTLVPRAEGTHFDAVVRSIVYQQLSGKAAATIHKRVLDLLDEKNPKPVQLMKMPDAKLRAAGLSGQKTRYVKGVAEMVHSGQLEIERLHDLSDDEIIAALTSIKGVGLWTAQMFLIFRLGRPDILPAGDLGIQKGVQTAYRMRKLPKPDKVLKMGRKWAPYRTVGAWYMWRLLDVNTPR